MIKSTVDLHTHTIASGHAYSTILEMARAASELGIKHLGITEHGPAIPGTCDPIYFRNLHVLPRELFGVKMLYGAELNILNTNGDIDLPESYDQYFSHIIAGIHKLCWEGGSRSENTDAVLSAMHSGRVNIISHPGDGTAELCFENLVLASRDTNCLLEINNASLKPARNLVGAYENNRKLLELCRKFEVPVILGSDAHFVTDIANYCHLLPLLSDTKFPDELILNNDFVRIEKFWSK